MAADPPRRARRGDAVLALACGLGLAAGQAPFDAWPVALAALAVLLARAQAVTGPRGAAWLGLWLGVGFAALAMSWIVEPFFVDVARHGWMAPFALAMMGAGFGLFWGAGLAFGASLAPRPGGPDRALALALGLTVAEVARSYLFTGFPWALIAYLWIPTPVYGLAALVGPHGLTLLTLAALSLGALAWRRRRKGPAFAALGLALGLALGPLILPRSLAAATGPGPVLRLVQPNVPQREKWDPALREAHFDRLLALTARPAGQGAGQPRLVIWPEVAVTFRLEDPAAPYDRIAAAAGGAAIVLGGQRVADGRAYNAMLALDGRGVPVALYDKHHLVPFGEYAPGGGLARALGLRGLAERLEFGFSPGPGPRLMDLPGGLRVLPMICYEAIFPHELRRAGPARPDMLLHLTNDAWFGAFSGPYQHLAQARARAIEFALPVVRVANTGVSAVIDARGRVRAELPLNAAGVLDAALPPAGAPTPYWRWGDNPAFLILFVLGLTLIARRRRKAD